MRKILFVFILTLIIIVGCSQQADIKPNQETQTIQNANQKDINSPQVNSASVEVDIKDIAFNPATVNINKGTTVTWTNRDAVKHTVTSDSGNELDSPILTQGQSYSHTFNDAGAFDYHCTIHPMMTAKVVVS